MFETLREDIRTVMSRDPAARSKLEVLVCYSGLHALWFYRTSNFFWRHRLYFLGRATSQFARFITGIEIHPGAKIGRRFFIDHGMAVVIGETAEIGDGVLMYQGVVLGGTTLEKKKRHPTVGNDVVIGAAAVLLGPIVVGDGARIGANSVVVKNVPPGATVVGVPGRVVEDRHPAEVDLEHGKLPDPVSNAIRVVFEEQHELAERIRKLEASMGVVISHTELDEEISRLEKVFSFADGEGI